MIAPALTVLLQDGRRTYEPNDILSVEYRLDSTAHIEAKAMEASVVWYTMGKGDEDFGVHHFVRHAADEGSVLDCRKPQRLQTVLPRSPLSYDGAIVKIRWCVRVRLFPTRGREMITEVPFRLGHVPPVTVAESTATVTAGTHGDDD
jgi:hypothetical protein